MIISGAELGIEPSSGLVLTTDNTMLLPEGTQINEKVWLDIFSQTSNRMPFIGKLKVGDTQYTLTIEDKGHPYNSAQTGWDIKLYNLSDIKKQNQGNPKDEIPLDDGKPMATFRLSAYEGPPGRLVFDVLTKRAIQVDGQVIIEKDKALMAAEFIRAILIFIPEIKEIQGIWNDNEIQGDVHRQFAIESRKITGLLAWLPERFKASYAAEKTWSGKIFAEFGFKPVGKTFKDIKVGKGMTQLVCFSDDSKITL